MSSPPILPLAHSYAPAQPAPLPVYAGIGLNIVTLVDSPALAAEALAELLACDAIGFDTESKPTFVKGEVSTGPHLVQLAAEHKVFLFPITPALDTDVLKQILEAPQILKAGFGLGNDQSALKSKLGIELNNVLDLGEVLRGPWHKGTVGTKTAVAHFFGQRFLKSKQTGTSNWSNPRLTSRQQLYAANDAHVALQVYRAWCRAGKTVESRP